MSWSALGAQVHGPPGSRPGTERWIAHFTKHYDRSTVRTAVTVDGAAGLDLAIRRLENQVQGDRKGFVSQVGTVGGIVTANWWLVDACAIEIPFLAVATLTGRQDVAFLEPDLAARATIRRSTANNNHAADAVHTRGFRGAGVTVAVMDTGQDENMNGVGRPHQTYYLGGNTANRQSGGIGGSRLIVNKKVGAMPADDPHGHGTAVAGVVVGEKWNNVVAGLGHAPDAHLAGYAIGDYLTGGGVFSYYSTMVSAWQAIVADRVRHNIVAANLSFSGDPNPLNVAQQALDNAALLGDILITTSAGNTASSTLSSPSSANAIAVGAVVADTHTMAVFSSRGPLVGDPLRSYPDMVACGVDVYMPWSDHETGWYRDSGTSMAAPQVCGAAALLRAAVPSLRAEETKAILLTSALDISAKNTQAPYNSPNAYGTGMLRDDRAMDIARQYRSHGRATLSASQMTFEVALAVRAGETHSFGISWFRLNVTSNLWSDLNLEIFDGAGVVVASKSPRNLYEVVQFTTVRSGHYVARVTGVSLSAAEQEFGWAFTGLTASADERQLHINRLGSSASSLGHSVSILGDVNGDGFDDFVCSAVVGIPNSRDLGVVRVVSGRNGEVLVSVGERVTSAAFGFVAAGVGDLNGDGIADFAVGSPEVTGSRGEVQLFSGSDGSTLAVLRGNSGDAFGTSIVHVGDIDGDGVSDFLVGAPQPPAGRGYAVLFSGKSRQILHTVNGTAVGAEFGASVAWAGDIDGDNTPDFAVGAPADGGSGSVSIFSGVTGGLIRVLRGRTADDRFGTSIAGGVDFDGDGRDDIVVGAPRAANATGLGSVELFSGQTGVSIRRLLGTTSLEHFGRSLCTVPDLDHDGQADLAVGSVPEDTAQRGFVSVFSAGKSLTHTLRGEINERTFGYAIAATDLNGDGEGDLIIGAPALLTGAIAGGSVQAFRALQVLTTDRQYVSLTAGGVQEFAIDASPALANAEYVIFGSATGVAPGAIVGGLHVPLEIDWYTAVSGMTANSAVLVNSLGTLDALGRAQARFVVPANTSSVLIGVELFHAVIVLRVARGEMLTASQGRSLRFEK